MYIINSLQSESNFTINHTKLINIPYLQPYTSALMEVCPLNVFGESE